MWENKFCFVIWFEINNFWNILWTLEVLDVRVLSLSYWQNHTFFASNIAQWFISYIQNCCLITITIYFLFEVIITYISKDNRRNTYVKEEYWEKYLVRCYFHVWLSDINSYHHCNGHAIICEYAAFVCHLDAYEPPPYASI